jgi:hypothetical protein
MGRQIVIVEMAAEDMLAGHIPEDIWQLSKGNDVFYEDKKTGEMVQVLDCTDL